MYTPLRVSRLGCVRSDGKKKNKRGGKDKGKEKGKKDRKKNKERGRRKGRKGRTLILRIQDRT